MSSWKLIIILSELLQFTAPWVSGSVPHNPAFVLPQIVFQVKLTSAMYQ